jgi:hypothetical protein
MAHVLDGIELSGWVIERRCSDYSFEYWVTFVIGLFGQLVPTPPDIIYTLRNPSSGEIRTIKLAGDHAPSDLVEAITRSRTDKAAGNTT